MDVNLKYLKWQIHNLQFCNLSKYDEDTMLVIMMVSLLTFSGLSCFQTADMINLEEGCKWDITKVTQRRRVESYSCNSNDIYEDIHYSITVKRKIPAYHSIVVIPAIGT